LGTSRTFESAVSVSTSTASESGFELRKAERSPFRPLAGPTIGERDMGSLRERDGNFFAQFVDGDNRRRELRVDARNRREAALMLAELEQRARRQRQGLEPVVSRDDSRRVSDLMAHWVECLKGSAGLPQEANRVQVHIQGGEIGRALLRTLRTERLNAFLSEKEQSGLSAASVNKLRAAFSRAFSTAISDGWWGGANVAKTAKRRKVARGGKGRALTADQVARVLAELPEKHRPKFAAMFGLSLRFGEAAGALRTAYDRRARTFTVARSWNRETTKGGGAAVALPVAAWLVPYLEQAFADSLGSRYLFPGKRGAMLSKNFPARRLLARALGRAGIVEHYRHVCRRKGCGEVVLADDPGLRRCPADNRLLWPVAVPIHFRVHDARHTGITLLLDAGAGPHETQQLARHADIRMTLEVYSHVRDGALRAAVERISLPYAKRADGKRMEAQRIASKQLPASSNPSDSGELDERAILDSNQWPSAPEADALSI
jgi:integrase